MMRKEYCVSDHYKICGSISRFEIIKTTMGCIDAKVRATKKKKNIFLRFHSQRRVLHLIFFLSRYLQGYSVHARFVRKTFRTYFAFCGMHIIAEIHLYMCILYMYILAGNDVSDSLDRMGSRFKFTVLFFLSFLFSMLECHEKKKLKIVFEQNYNL